MQSHKPAISVIITSYNYAQYIAGTIYSVQAQTFEDWEIVIVDDGSSDNSVQIIESLAAKDSRIRFMQHPNKGNLGLIASMQLGMKNAKADIITFLESDDELLPTSIEKRYKHMQVSKAEVVISAVIFNTEQGVGVEHYEFFQKLMQARYGKIERTFAFGAGVMSYNPIFTFSCIMLKKDILALCDFSPPNNVWIDWWIWMQLAHKPIFSYMSEPLTNWRIHKQSYNYNAANPLELKKAFRKEFRKRFFTNYYKDKRYVFCIFLLIPTCLSYWISKFIFITKVQGLAEACRYIFSRIWR